MSLGSWDRVHVECPFYKGDDARQTITCEATVPDCSNKLQFRTRDLRKQHMQLFCCQLYKNCEQYRAVMANYNEEG